MEPSEKMVYQEQAGFIRKAQNFRELTEGDWNVSRSRFRVEQIVVLPDEQYREFRENGLMEDQIFLFDHQDKMWMDPSDFCWHCVLVKGENSKDGILVEAEGFSYARYASYVPDAEKLRLQDVPVHYEGGFLKDVRAVQNADERNRMEHYLSFVGVEMNDLAFSFRFTHYDVGTDQFTTRLYGGPNSYIEEKMTPKQLTDSKRFPEDFLEKFRDMNYRYQGEEFNCLPAKKTCKKKSPHRGDAR